MAKTRPLTRRMRLSGEKSFADVFAAKCSAADRYLVIYVLQSGEKQARLGLSVSRRAGGAIQRNRIKRLLREAFRLERDEVPSGFDIVLVPRNVPATLAIYRSSIRSVLHRAVARCRAKQEE